jgi:hypothetical protein
MPVSWGVLGKTGGEANVFSARMLVTVEVMIGHSMQVAVSPAFVRVKEVQTLCCTPRKLRILIGRRETPSRDETLRWMLD